jgi:hypothetical protein
MLTHYSPLVGWLPSVKLGHKQNRTALSLVISVTPFPTFSLYLQRTWSEGWEGRRLYLYIAIIYTHTHICIYIYMLHESIHIRLYIYIYTHTYVYIFVCVYFHAARVSCTRVCSCMLVCARVCSRMLAYFAYACVRSRVVECLQFVDLRHDTPVSLYPNIDFLNRYRLR